MGMDGEHGAQGHMGTLVQREIILEQKQMKEYSPQGDVGAECTYGPVKEE
ncbi:MAG: hypothetical protein V2A69_10145 [Pseudomonadota bacterium]